MIFFLSCLNHYQSLIAAELEFQFNQESSALGFIQLYLDQVLQESQQTTTKKGCLFVNTINEMSQHDEIIAETLVKGTSQVSEFFRKVIDLGKDSGEITSETDSKALAEYLLMSFCGLRTLVKAGASEATLKPVVKLILEALK